VYCQSSFTYKVKTPKDERLFDAIEDESGNYLMVGRKMSVDSEIQSAYYLFLNNYGNLIAEREFYCPDSSSWFGGIWNRNDSTFIFGAKGSTTTDIKNELWLMIMDDNFNLILNKSFVMEDNNIIDLELIVNNKGNFLICGIAVNPITDADIFFYELSSEGDSVNLTYFPFNNTQFEFDIIEKPFGGYTVFGDGIFPDFLPIAGKMIDFDSAYNYVSVDTIPYGLRSNNSAKWLSNSTYLVTGKKTIDNTTNSDLGIVKLNTTDQLIQGNHFGKIDTNHHVGACSNLDFVTYDNIYFGGTANVVETYIYQPQDSWIILNNLDSNLNLNWQKFYGGDAFYYLWGLRATQDGGCLMMATRYDTTFQDQELDIYILKVDSLGLLTSAGNQPSVPVQQLAIAPNPARDFVSVRYPDIFGNNEKEIVIYNSLGMPVINVSATQDLTETIVNLSDLPAGLYFIVLKVKGKNVATGKMVKK
jgi:hypothetical protein